MKFMCTSSTHKLPVIPIFKYRFKLKVVEKVNYMTKKFSSHFIYDQELPFASVL